jgi:hypothetical protein
VHRPADVGRLRQAEGPHPEREREKSHARIVA